MIRNIKQLIQVKTRQPADQLDLLIDGRILPDDGRLNTLGITQYSILLLQKKQVNAAPPANNFRGAISDIVSRVTQTAQTPSTDPAVFRSMVLADSNLLTQLLNNDKILAEAVLSEDDTLLTALLQERERQKNEIERRRNQEIDQINSNLYSADAQAVIEEKIRSENVKHNIESAMEHHPESFGRVYMLYIPCEVNGHPVQAFVDSGAQQTIMSVECAKRCGVMRLVDTRFSGVAQGVGTAPIIGRVHLAPIKIGNSFFPCSFTIIDNQKQNLDFLLGLDMLKRHQCCVDLRNDLLRIGDEEIQFLPESSIMEKPDNISQEDEERVLKAQRERLPETMKQKEKDEKMEDIKDVSDSNNTPESAGEADILSIIELGYPREAAREALIVCGGDKQKAVNYLFEFFM